MELAMKLSAAPPLNGELLIGVGASVVDGHEDLVGLRIVMYGPESVRSRNGGGGDREGHNNRHARDPDSLRRACAHVCTYRVMAPDSTQWNSAQ